MTDALGVIAASWGVLMALSPILQIRRTLERRTSADISISYLAVLQVGFMLWVGYGIALDNAAIIVPNSVAFLIGVATILIALRYREGGVRGCARIAIQARDQTAPGTKTVVSTTANRSRTAAMPSSQSEMTVVWLGSRRSMSMLSSEVRHLTLRLTGEVGIKQVSRPVLRQSAYEVSPRSPAGS